MRTNLDNLNHFFEKIKSITFWQRIFSWKQLIRLSYDAYEEYKSCAETIDRISTELDETKTFIKGLGEKNELLKDQIEDLKQSNHNLDKRISNKEIEITNLTNENKELNKKITKFEQSEENRKEEYERNVTSLNTIKKGLEEERQRIQDERIKEKEAEFERMKSTWSTHEENVKNAILSICKTNFIEYVEKVPFKGNPDNTIQICDEYIVFDAKSPASNDLQNFPNYIKIQTESVKKYIKQEKVKKEIFLVIPSNTIEVIDQYIYHMGDYNVYIITLDSLEPIILSLKKIEDYEFVEELTPEERENICRIIGKFAHTTKRKIQIDQFFTWQFLEILTKCKSDLPPGILEMVIEYEKAEKLNPPQEKRSKQILITDLEKDSERIISEARTKEIAIPESTEEENKS